MSTIIVGGLMFAGLAFLAREIKLSQKELEHYQQIEKIEQELERTKDKFLWGLSR